MAKILDKFFNRIIEVDLILSEKEKKSVFNAPVFEATIEEDLEHEKIDVVMEQADRNDILTNKYPVICLKIPDEENEGKYNYMFFKADVYNEDSNGIQYCLWLGEIDNETKSINKLELTFVWDGDEAKAVFEEQTFAFSSLSEVLTFSDGHAPSTSGNLSVRTHSWTTEQASKIDPNKPLFIAYDYDADSTADVPITVVNYDNSQIVYIDYGRGATSTRVKIIQ